MHLGDEARRLAQVVPGQPGARQPAHAPEQRNARDDAYQREHLQLATEPDEPARAVVPASMTFERGEGGAGGVWGPTSPGYCFPAISYARRTLAGTSRALIAHRAVRLGRALSKSAGQLECAAVLRR